MSKLRLITGFIIFSIFGFFGVLVLTAWVALDQNVLEEKEKPFGWCGTAFLPSSRATSLDHPGRIIVENNCLQCHSIVRDVAIVGPSLCRNLENDSLVNLKFILFDDPDSVLKNSQYYNNLSTVIKIDFHRGYKFDDDFTENQKVHLISYLDTLSLMQQ